MARRVWSLRATWDHAKAPLGHSRHVPRQPFGRKVAAIAETVHEGIELKYDE